MFGEFENVYDVLKNDDRLVASDGTLMKNRIYELSSKLDETFLNLEDEEYYKYINEGKNNENDEGIRKI